MRDRPVKLTDILLTPTGIASVFCGFSRSFSLPSFVLELEDGRAAQPHLVDLPGIVLDNLVGLPRYAGDLGNGAARFEQADNSVLSQTVGHQIGPAERRHELLDFSPRLLR